LSKKIYRI